MSRRLLRPMQKKLRSTRINFFARLSAMHYNSPLFMPAGIAGMDAGCRLA